MNTKERDKDQDMLIVINKRIEKELKHGDKSKAAKEANISVATLDRGLAKKSIDDVSDDQYNGIVALMKRLNSRRSKQEKLEGYVN